MCCFSQPINWVGKTSIFARLTGRGSQYLVYQMSYDSSVPNAMVLPLPTTIGADESAVRFISLDDVEDFFQNLRRGFPFRRSISIGCSGGHDFDVAGMLEIQEVGDYIASFVPSIDDFDRLAPRFVIPKATWSQIPEYEDYGFAVFQLKTLKAKSHPMALEFPTRHPDQVFFPTVHIHDGLVHDQEDFDHQLFLQHAGFDSVVGSYQNADVADANTNFVRSKYPASEFAEIDRCQGILNGDLLIHKTALTGILPNQDHWFTIEGDPNVTTLNLKRWIKFWPVTVTAAAAWFLARRSRLRRQKTANAKCNQVISVDGNQNERPSAPG